LLGPEGTAENAKPLGLIRRRNHDFISKVFKALLSTARILRTTQWTRASLWSNY
jgi:hypothetical protein